MLYNKVKRTLEGDRSTQTCSAFYKDFTKRSGKDFVMYTKPKSFPQGSADSDSTEI